MVVRGKIVDETLRYLSRLRCRSLCDQMAEADFVSAKPSAENLATLHCKLGFRIGVRKGEVFGRAGQLWPGF